MLRLASMRYSHALLARLSKVRTAMFACANPALFMTSLISNFFNAAFFLSNLNRHWCLPRHRRVCIPSDFYIHQNHDSRLLDSHRCIRHYIIKAVRSTEALSIILPSSFKVKFTRQSGQPSNTIVLDLFNLLHSFDANADHFVRGHSKRRSVLSTTCGGARAA